MSRRRSIGRVLVLIAVLGSSCASASQPEEPERGPARRWPSPVSELNPDQPALWTIEVVGRVAHDASAFTQGLEQLTDAELVESTGIEGRSEIRILDSETGTVIRSESLGREEFGEGATVVGDVIVQLTWRNERARRWLLPDLVPLDPFVYAGEGWGLCLLEDQLAMSDGTSTLRFRSAEDFAVLSEVTVTNRGQPVTLLNELECVDGHIIANVWQSSDVLVIRPDGQVVATIDASPLTAENDSRSPEREVLNGVAVRDQTTMWMTGKLWSTMFAVSIVDSR